MPINTRETYYAHYAWGGPFISVLGASGFVAPLDLRPDRYRFYRHAVVVPRDHFYSVTNYTQVRVKNIHHTTTINNYQVAPVIDKRVFKDYDRIRHRHHYANIEVKQKPHHAGIDRVRQNEMRVRKGGRTSASTLNKSVKGMPEGGFHRQRSVSSPKAKGMKGPGLAPEGRPLKPEKSGKPGKSELKGPVKKSAKHGNGGKNDRGPSRDHGVKKGQAAPQRLEKNKGQERKAQNGGPASRRMEKPKAQERKAHKGGPGAEEVVLQEKNSKNSNHGGHGKNK